MWKSCQHIFNVTQINFLIFYLPLFLMLNSYEQVNLNVYSLVGKYVSNFWVRHNKLSTLFIYLLYRVKQVVTDVSLSNGIPMSCDSNGTVLGMQTNKSTFLFKNIKLVRIYEKKKNNLFY